MSEQLRHHEHAKDHESLVSKEHQEKLETEKHAEAERAKAETGAEKLDEIREKVTETAKISSDIEVGKHQPAETAQLSQKELKDDAYKRLLTQVRRHLPRSQRTLSKVMHNKTVEAINSVGAKTIARPSGLLGGSVFAFIGSIVLLYASKHYGFKYNYSFFLFCFVAGFAFGAVLEMLVWLFWSRRRGHLAD